MDFYLILLFSIIFIVLFINRIVVELKKTNKFSGLNSGLISINFDQSNKKKSVNDFFNRVIEIAEKAEKSIKIVDFNTPYSNAKSHKFGYERFYTQIEEIISNLNPDIEYIRICQIPDSDSSMNSMFTRLLKDKVNKATYNHINNCYKASDNFKFYVTETFKPFSFLIVDDEIILSKYDFLAKSKHRLDEIYITTDKKIVDSRLRAINSVVKSNKELSHEEFKNYSFETLEYQQAKLAFANGLLLGEFDDINKPIATFWLNESDYFDKRLEVQIVDDAYEGFVEDICFYSKSNIPIKRPSNNSLKRLVFDYERHLSKLEKFTDTFEDESDGDLLKQTFAGLT